MIPKIIHRCWFSDELPDKNSEIGKCFYSQDKLQDYGYEIRTYTSKNFDFSISKYLLQAYSLKRWAFCTDYVRIWALYNFGGIYLDGDVEIINPQSFDYFLEGNYLLNCPYKVWDTENTNKNNPWDDLLIDGGVIGVQQHDNIIKQILDYMNSICFIKNNHICNKSEDILEYKIKKIYLDNNLNFKLYNGNKQNYVINTINDNRNVYLLNTEYFGDINYEKHKDDNINIIGIHKRLGTWYDNREFNDLDIFIQQEYCERFNKNRITTINSNIVYTFNNYNNYDTLYNTYNFKNINENDILNKLINEHNISFINLSKIKNISLFKFLLKNIDYNNTIYIDENYNVNILYDITDNILNNSLFIYKK